VAVVDISGRPHIQFM